jgi:cardiolipin synthase
MSWILVISFIPIAGIILYFYIGKNYRKEKLFSRKGLKDLENLSKMSERQMHNFEERILDYTEEIKEKKSIMKLLLNSNKALLTEYNQVEVLIDGKNTFRSILQSLEQAKQYIHMEYYAIEDGHIGNMIRDVLVRKAREGVKFRPIYADLGSWSLSSEFIESLQKAGAELYAFMPVRIIYLANKINYRNHRKIIVVDGKEGFVGGLNIADRYVSGNKEVGSWHDTHLKLQGEAVQSLHSVFLIDWYFVSGEQLDWKQFKRRNTHTNKCLVQIAASGPDSDWASIMQAYFTAIATARKYIYIASPYFIPNESIRNALNNRKSLSGVEVRIMLPAYSDNRILRWGTMSYVGDLLEAGIHVHHFRKGFTHSRLMLVDDVFCSVGTANMDIRSFDQNFEVNAIIYDQGVCSQIKEGFLKDLKFCSEANLSEWENRSRFKTGGESFARIFTPLL